MDGAINALTRCLAVELGSRGIRVNAVSPGLIDDTDIKPTVGSELVQEFNESALKAIPLHRKGLPTEVADATYFLATCQYASDQVIEVDGGWSAI